MNISPELPAELIPEFEAIVRQIEAHGQNVSDELRRHITQHLIDRQKLIKQVMEGKFHRPLKLPGNMR